MTGIDGGKAAEQREREEKGQESGKGFEGRAFAPFRRRRGRIVGMQRLRGAHRRSAAAEQARLLFWSLRRVGVCALPDLLRILVHLVGAPWFATASRRIRISIRRHPKIPGRRSAFFIKKL